VAGAKDVVFPFDGTLLSGTALPFYTGFAIANLDTASAPIVCVARDQAGIIIPNALPVPQIPGLGHWAGYSFPALSGHRGSVECTSVSDIAVTALRFIGDGAFASLPVIEMTVVP
jgi:hypothetical protein